MKTCTKCGVQKPLEGFLYRKDTKKYRNHCKMCVKKLAAKNHKKSRKDRLKKLNEYYHTHKEEKRAYLLENSDRINKVRRARHKKRYTEDPTYRIKMLIRNSCNDKRRFNNKSNISNKLIGCTWKYLKHWLESQMTDTMTFKTIHIDHMMPVASFDLTKPEEQRKACHYTNLQPMLPSENMAKGSKIIYDMRWNGQQWEINRSGIYELRDKNLK